MRCFLAPGLLVVSACGVTGGPTTVGPPVETPTSASGEPLPTSAPREDPWVLFASTILDASHALHAAAFGNPYDEKWNCADSKSDIRSTDPDAAKKLTMNGTPEHLLTTLDNFTLSSPIDPKMRSDEPADPEDEASNRPRTSRVVLHGTFFVFADGRIRWFQMSARGSSYSGSGSGSETDAAVRLKRLPPEVRGAVSDLVTTLSSSSCTLPFMGEADLAPLPIEQSKKESAIEAIEHEMAELHHSCEMAARASGPWDARLSGMQIVYRVGAGIATLGAELKVESGRLCIGRGSAYGR